MENCFSKPNLQQKLPLALAKALEKVLINWYAKALAHPWQQQSIM